MSNGTGPPPILRELAIRAAVASRLRSVSEDHLLESILEAAVALFRAGAGSMALVMRNPDRLEFVVSAGPHTGDIVGKSIGIGEGLAGYVVQTGEAIAIADPGADPRFGRSVAERTGVMPKSLLAVPLRALDSVVGVLEILDAHDGSFGPDDIALASIFARQAAIAIESTRVEREFPVLLGKVLEAYGLDLEPELRDDLKSLSARTDDDFWVLVDEIAALGDASPAFRSFLKDLLPLARVHMRDATWGRARG
jgi:GAF domain-containing protein